MAYTVGFVYVLSNPAMPGMVKVGRSRHLPEDRAKRLRSTGVPLSFAVEHRAVTSKPAAVERRAHQLLAPHRLRADREFFETEPEVAMAAVRQACIEVAGIEAWDTERPVMLRDGDRVALTLRAGQFFAVLPYRRSGKVEPPLDFWQAHSDGDLLELMATDSPEHVAGFGTGDPGGDTDPVPYLDRSEDAANGFIIGRERLEPGQRLLWLDGKLKPPAAALGWFEFDSYCQAVCRTWSPQVSEEGFPLLLNFPTEEPTPTMIDVVSGCLRLPKPQLSTPPPVPSDSGPDFGSSTASPAYWLRQLNPPERRRRPARGA
ncbi:GIY-YIG nuclease family protein [Plantactinospora sp. WMMB334]|uniref:GIY-YIG nuclease family protein n=1 Tax=Plantactinospora sp. WMMB334 TaxID=3404119 RepID=UPI003B950934